MTSRDKQSGQNSPPSGTNNQPKAGVIRPGWEPAKRTLRERAEEITRHLPKLSLEDTETLSREEINRTLHELQVHQVELQMQNEDLRRNQVELEAARDRYFDFYDNAPVGYCTLSEYGLILEANLTAANLFGVPRGELVMQPISRFIAGEFHDTYYLHRKQLFSTGKTQSCELRLVRKDGSTLWAGLQAIAARNTDDMPVCRVVIADISERKQADDALRETNALLSLFMQHTPVYAFIKEVTRENSRVLMASENFKDMVGIPGSAMAGMTMEDLFPAEFAAKVNADDLAIISSGKMYTLEERFNGRIYTTIKFPVPLGEKTLLAGYTLDITESRQAQEEKARLETVNRQLQKSASLGRMAGAIAHLFNNKLHVVMGHLELTKESLTRGDTSSYNLSAAMLAAGQAAEVSKMMLTYLGHVTGKQEPLDLSEACRKNLAALRANMPKDVTLEAEMPSPGPAVKANAKQIQQVLTNLITNAWESAESDRPVVIHLTTRTVSPADISIAHRFPVNWQPEDCAYACLEIRDNGCGITEEDLEEVFSPFFTTKFTGRGLGLPMVLGLVQAHGGVVTVESKRGSGSIFRVYLPISAEEVPQQPIDTDVVEDIQQAGTILLVDDEEIVVDITSRMLARLGFTIVSARDGIEALEVFLRHRNEIRLVLSDVSMPRMNGWETLTALRQLSPGIPVILASGYSEEQVMDGTHPEKPQAFLGKPYGFKDLRNAIQLSLADAARPEASVDTLETNDSQPKEQGEMQ